MGIDGYKSFNLGLINNYGYCFILNKTYSVGGELRFGVKGNGFHFAKRIEDTFRYSGGISNPTMVIASVTGLGKVIEFSDDYYGYDDLYCSQSLRVNRVLSRKEIVNYFLELDVPYRVERFIMGYKLNEDEIEMFKFKYANCPRIISAILYYQERDLDVYKRQYRKRIKKGDMDV